MISTVLDIAVVTLLIYLVLVFIRQTRSFVVLGTIVALIVLNFLANKLQLNLTSALMQPLITSFVVIFVVVFQREIRRFFEWISFPTRRRWLGTPQLSAMAAIPPIIVESVREMAKRKIGALIVLAGDYPLDTLIQGGLPLGGQPSVPLILSIFDPTSPGHDGAIIVEDGTIKTFGAHLPLAENFKHFAKLGTRHRAALGLTERTDALVIVVSEERGVVSVARGKTLESMESPHDLERAVRAFLQVDEAGDPRASQWFKSQNLYIGVGALALALLLWALT